MTIGRREGSTSRSWLRRPDATDIAPFVILAAAVVALLVVPPLSGRDVGSLNGYDILQNFAFYGLVALGLGLTMLIGEFDLSISAMFALGAMVAVLTGSHHPWVGVLVAIVVGLAIGSVQGSLVSLLDISSMPVTVGGYIALLGLTRVLGHDSSVGYANYDVGAALDSTILSVLSLHSLIVIGLFCCAGGLLRFTRWGRDIRAAGGGRRASQIAGVRVSWVIVGVFASASAAAGLGGALTGYSLATATPDLASLDTLVFAATAVLLGGILLGGGRGGVIGIACGTLALSIVQEILAITAAPTYISQLVTGGLLVATSAIAAPDLMRWWRTRDPFWPNRSPTASRRGEKG